MAAVLLTGHGGSDKLIYRTDVPVPRPGPGEVLIKVAASGINNTDINTRTAWYSKRVTGATAEDDSPGAGDDGSWSGEALAFPRIQGNDCCGYIVAVGDDADTARIGERVLVNPLLKTPAGGKAFFCWTFGSECDGGFAQYAKAPAREVFKVDSDWSDAELASMPCAFATAENMLHRATVGAERVLVTGASGGVGSAAVQLAKRRGAHVTAVCGQAKFDAVRDLGADEVVARDADLIGAFGPDSFDVVIDLVAGPQWQALPDLLRRGGRYAVAGAIAGPLVELDVRTLYLKDLTFLGCTYQADNIMPDLIGYIERNEIRPMIAKTYPLAKIAEAQEDFLSKKHTGKLVLIPPQEEMS
jgi:NADPH:quinone reductase-like Zn-dependent oxidoreductase